VGCYSSICWWFTVHTRICWGFSLLSICWSSFRLQPRWVSFAAGVYIKICAILRVCLFFRVERVTACGSKVGKMDIVGGPEVCNSSWILCVLELAYIVWMFAVQLSTACSRLLLHDLTIKFMNLIRELFYLISDTASSPLSILISIFVQYILWFPSLFQYFYAVC
jgi:hypothetical protein